MPNKKLSIQYINFLKQKDKDFAGVGLFDPDLNKIYIHNKLPDVNAGTKKLCLKHELAHYSYRYIDLNLFLTSEQEESFIEVLGIITCGYQYLSIGERLLKKYILKNGKLHFKKDYRVIINKILEFLNISLSSDQLEKIYRRY